MKFVFQMDPLEKLTSKTDSTIAIIKAALKKDVESYYYVRSSLYLEGKDVFATTYRLQLDHKNNLIVTSKKYKNLAEFDCLFVRDEPPFDMSYITATYILDLLKDKVLILNDPTALRNLPEKLSSLKYYKYMVPSCVSEDIDKLSSFMHRHNQVVIKPLYSFGGNDVEHIESASDLVSLYNKMMEKYQGLPVMLQKYIPEVSKGDKRVFIFNGKIKGVVNRIPEAGSIVANLIAGGKAEKSSLSESEYKISMELARDLQKEGIIIAGIDLINGYLSEINVTCPTGIVTINELENYHGDEKIENQIVSELIKQLL